MNETPRFMVKADDDFSGLITVYVEYVPDDFNDEGEADRWAVFNYGKDGVWNRMQARIQAEGIARRWTWEISKRWPCEWGTNWREPR